MFNKCYKYTFYSPLLLQISKKSVHLHCVFHSIRFKVNKGWSTAVLLFLCLYVPSPSRGTRTTQKPDSQPPLEECKPPLGRAEVDNRILQVDRHWCSVCQTLMSNLTDTGVCRDKHWCLTNRTPMPDKHAENALHRQLSKRKGKTDMPARVSTYPLCPGIIKLTFVSAPDFSYLCIAFGGHKHAQSNLTNNKSTIKNRKLWQCIHGLNVRSVTRKQWKME